MPDWKSQVRARLPLLREPAREAEIVEELAQHLEAVYEEALAAGAGEAEAQAAAVAQMSDRLTLERELGGRAPAAFVPAVERRFPGLEALGQDLRYGARMLLKQPAFAFVAVLTLALGIGANTAIFSVVNAVILRPLPYPRADRLLALESVSREGGAAEFSRVSPADFQDWQAQSRVFERIAAYGGSGLNLRDGEQSEPVAAARVSVNTFETFGMPPMLGRTFAPEEGMLHAPAVMVVGYRLWQRRFGGDPAIVGRAVQTDSGPVTVIGVMPRAFKFPGNPEAWEPLSADSGEMKIRGTRYFSVVGRLKDGETPATAEAEMRTIADRLAAAWPKDDRNLTVRVTPWRDHLARGGREALLILMGAVALVLLIACSNVANLLLARAAGRRKEMAIRVALGAGRWRLLRQSLVEGLLLGVAGGAAGLLLAGFGVNAIAGLLPRFGWTFQAVSNARDEIGIDAAALAFTLAVSLSTGVLFGFVPGWHASRAPVDEALKEEGRSTESRRQRRTRGALVVAETALALMLLIGAGLLLQSFARLRSVDLGYQPQRLLTMSLTLPRNNPAAYVRQVLDQVARAPGVESAAAMSWPTPGGLNFPFNLEAHPLAAGDQMIRYSAISPDYFRTLAVPLRAGRGLDDRDRAGAHEVAVVNDSLARRYFGGESPLGQTIVLNYMGQRQAREIVGVVGDVKQDDLSRPARPEVMVPFEQQPWLAAWVLVRTTASDPLHLRNEVQRAIWSVDKTAPASTAATIEEQLDQQLSEPRLYSLLLGLFAGVAMLLAAIGLYGVMAYSVSQRRHEIGVRMALGAQEGEVLRMVVRQGMMLATAGVGLGLVGALAATRILASLLFGVTATDPLTFAGIVALLSAVAFVSCYLPARRATKIDPAIALRSG